MCEPSYAHQKFLCRSSFRWLNKVAAQSIIHRALLSFPMQHQNLVNCSKRKIRRAVADLLEVDILNLTELLEKLDLQLKLCGGSKCQWDPMFLALLSLILPYYATVVCKYARIYFFISHCESFQGGPFGFLANAAGVMICFRLKSLWIFFKLIVWSITE